MSIGFYLPIDNEPYEEPTDSEIKRWRAQEVLSYTERMEKNEISYFKTISRRVVFLAASPFCGSASAAIYTGLFLLESLCIFDYNEEFRGKQGLLDKEEKKKKNTALTIATAGSIIGPAIGCIGNSLLTAHHEFYPCRAQRVPFFLIGALGIVMGVYATNQRFKRNSALMMEADIVLNE